MLWNKKKIIVALLLVCTLSFSPFSVSNAVETVWYDTVLPLPQLTETNIAWVVFQCSDGNVYLVTVQVNHKFYDGIPADGGVMGGYKILYDLNVVNNIGIISSRTDINGIADYMNFWCTIYNLKTGQVIGNTERTVDSDWSFATTYMGTYSWISCISDGFTVSSAGSFGAHPFGIRWSTGEDTTSDSVKSGVDEANKEAEEREKETATSQGDSSVSESEDSIANESESITGSVAGFVSAMSYNGTDCSLTIPEIYMPAIDGVMSRTVLYSGGEMDLKYWINQIPCLDLVQVLLTISLCLFGVKEFYSLIYELLNNRKESLDE